MVKVETRNGMLAVTCPYSQAFLSFAKMRNGKWSDSLQQRLFDPRDEFAVRSTLVDIYGTDDYESCAKTAVRVDLDKLSNDLVYVEHLFLLGRELAQRKFPDRYVDLGTDVVAISGGFPHKSRRGVDPLEGTVLEVRGVPIMAAEKALQDYPAAITVLGEYDITALQEERDYHAKRLAELDGLIARYSGIFREDDIIADLQDDDDEASANSSEQAVEG
ncbi:MAG: hypothetical protein VB144_11365 [Clostridia bacterium]|nr:hypothetical protein [Clostridia bacterium]